MRYAPAPTSSHATTIESKKMRRATNPGALFEPLESRRLFAAAVVDTDATPAQASDLRTLATSRALRANNSLGANDRADCFRFSLDTDRNVAIKLDQLSANLNLELLDTDGDLITRSARSGTTKEFISTRLGRGTYFLRVFSDGAASKYRLNVSDTTEQTFFALTAQVTAAAVSGDIFLRVPSAAGEVTRTGYASWIGVDSYAWGLSVPDGVTAAKANFTPISIQKPFDKSSVRLFLLTAQRTIERSCLLAVFDSAAGIERLRITLGSVQVNSFISNQHSGSPGQDSLSLVFQTIRVRYIPVNSQNVAQAPIEAGWNLKTNKAI